MRVLLKVAYDGTNYHGWQFQQGMSTVEGAIRESLLSLLGKSVETYGASRTDAGVHALGNLAVFDTDSSIPADRFKYALNEKLPEDIRITESAKVPKDFFPRFAAIDKTYEYSIYNGEILLPTTRLYSHHYRGNLDIDSMNLAGEFISGEHNFTSLSSVHSQTSNFVRTVYSCKTRKEKDMVIISVKGNGFLYNMVRIIAGTLLNVGTGKLAPDSIPAIIDAKDRALAGTTLPAKGLCLMEINCGL